MASTSGLEFSTKGLQTVCPTGITSFDNLIGGGFALTSINIIDEDQFRCYSSMVIKAYLSSAIYSEQELLIFSPCMSIKNKKSRFIRELPSFQTVKNDHSDNKINRDDKEMKIAFRYSKLPSRFDDDNGQNNESSNKKFDFSNHIDENLLEKARIEFYDHKDILEVLEKRSKNSNSNSTVCRIWIDQLGSPSSSIDNDKLAKLLHQIKILMRQLNNYVCLIGIVSSSAIKIPNYDLLDTIDYSGQLLRKKIYFNSDFIIKFIAFDDYDDKNNPYKQDYNGIIQLLCLPRLNSFAPYNPYLDTTEYGIKLHYSKKFLTIEKLALPPDLGETVNRFTLSSDHISTSCSSNNSNKNIDF